MTWTQARVHKLSLLWVRGLDASEIAARLGIGEGKKNIVLARAYRSREVAIDHSEHELWTRRSDTPKNTTTTGTTKRTVSTRTANFNAAGQHSQGTCTIKHEDKIALIDTITVAKIVTTDAEVNEAFRKRMLFGMHDKHEKDASWSSPRYLSEGSTVTVLCTEPVGHGPCGQAPEPGTARCKEHGGQFIRQIKRTGDATKDPVHQAE